MRNDLFFQPYPPDFNPPYRVSSPALAADPPPAAGGSPRPDLDFTRKPGWPASVGWMDGGAECPTVAIPVHDDVTSVGH